MVRIWKNEGEWTGKVEISTDKEEIPGSKPTKSTLPMTSYLLRPRRRAGAEGFNVPRLSYCLASSSLLFLFLPPFRSTYQIITPLWKAGHVSKELLAFIADVVIVGIISLGLSG